MTIALVLPSLPGYSETFINSKIKGLVENGFEVILMVVGVSEKRDMLVPVYYQPVIAAKGIKRWIQTALITTQSLLLHPLRSLRLISDSKNSGHSITESFRLLTILSNFLKINADWVHFAFGTMAVERAIIGKVLNAKVSMSIRGYDISIVPVMQPNVYDEIWPYLDKIHCISKDLKNELRNLQPNLKVPIEIINPAITEQTFLNDDDSRFKAKPRIITVSRLHWKKGLEYSLQALAKLTQDFHFTIVGDGPERERLIFAANQLDLIDKVSFVGIKSPEEISELLKVNDYYLQYSIQEGFCNAVLEAQASGLICISSDAEGLSENLSNEKTGFIVQKRNPKALALKISEVFNLSEERKQSISKSAKQRVRENFTIEIQKQKFKNFFQE